MLKPIVFTKVTRKYIRKAISDLNITEDSKEIVYKMTMDKLRTKRKYLKDMKAISYFLGKNHLEIAFYSKDNYFTKIIDF